MKNNDYSFVFYGLLEIKDFKGFIRSFLLKIIKHYTKVIKTFQ